MVALVVKSGWVGGDRAIFMSIFSVDSLAFAAALKAKLEQEVQFVKVVSYLN